MGTREWELDNGKTPFSSEIVSMPAEEKVAAAKADVTAAEQKVSAAKADVAAAEQKVSAAKADFAAKVCPLLLHFSLLAHAMRCFVSYRAPMSCFTSHSLHSRLQSLLIKLHKKLWMGTRSASLNF